MAGADGNRDDDRVRPLEPRRAAATAPGRSVEGRPRSKGWLGVAVGVVLLLVFLPAFGFGGTSGDDEVVEAQPDHTTTSAPRTTTTATTTPDPVGPHVTSYGTWSWRRAAGGSPQGGVGVRDGGFVAADGQRLWVSADGVTWDVQAIPKALADRSVRFFEVGLEAWAVARPWFGVGTTEVFRAVEDDWVPAEVPETGAVEIEGVTLEYSPSSPTQLGSTTVVPVDVIAEVPWAEFSGTVATPGDVGDPPGVGPWPDWEGGARGPIRLRHPVSGELITTVGVEAEMGDPTVIEFVDEATAAVIHTVVVPDPGRPAEALLAALLWAKPVSTLLWVGDEAGLDAVSVPWGADGEFAQILAVDGRFIAYVNHVRGVARSGVQVWTSPDGRSWSREPDAAFGGDRVTWVQVQASHGVALALAANEPGGFALWRSLDGLRWEPVDLAVDASSRTELSATPQGWMLIEMTASARLVVWLSSDGRSWEPLPDAAALRLDSMVRSGAFFGWEVAGQTVFVRGIDDRGLPVLFVGRLEEI